MGVACREFSAWSDGTDKALAHVDNSWQCNHASIWVREERRREEALVFSDSCSDIHLITATVARAASLVGHWYTRERDEVHSRTR